MELSALGSATLILSLAAFLGLPVMVIARYRALRHRPALAGGPPLSDAELAPLPAWQRRMLIAFSTGMAFNASAASGPVAAAPLGARQSGPIMTRLGGAAAGDGHRRNRHCRSVLRPVSEMRIPDRPAEPPAAAVLGRALPDTVSLDHVRCRRTRTWSGPSPYFGADSRASSDSGSANIAAASYALCARQRSCRLAAVVGPPSANATT
jgi:hypothetical protein